VRKFRWTFDRSALPDFIFRSVLRLSALCVIALLLALFVTLLEASFPSIREFGAQFLASRTWDPVAGEFGAAPFLVGTLITSLLALLIATPFSLSIAILLGEFKKSGAFAGFLKSVIELLAGIPSIIYGFWGLFFLVPVVRALEIKLNVLPYGVGIFTASLILAVMIIPYSATIGREMISMVPQDIKEAAYSLGATRFEVIRKVVIPYAWSGIFAGIALAFGRALGETMAVTMLIGNSNFLPDSLFSPSNTMASVIANEFAEATEDIYLASLVEIGLILFLVSGIFSLAGKKVIDKFGRNQ